MSSLDDLHIAQRSVEWKLPEDYRAQGEVDIWTDGSCGQDGWGGWCAILIGRYGKVREICGTVKPKTTNQKMELLAAINGLAALRWEGVRVNVYSDSAYLVNCFHQLWIPSWRARGWRASGGKKIKNRTLWETLESLVEVHRVQFIKVAGHDDGRYPWNERADMLSRAVRVRDSQAEYLKEARKARIERPT